MKVFKFDSCTIYVSLMFSMPIVLKWQNIDFGLLHLIRSLSLSRTNPVENRSRPSIFRAPLLHELTIPLLDFEILSK